jgi:hypothetical protein
VRAGVRWARPDAFRRDLDVEPEYRELRERRSITFELVLSARPRKRLYFGSASPVHLYADRGGGPRNYVQKTAAVIRRAAEDGVAVRVTESKGWVPERLTGRIVRSGKRALWRKRRTLTVGGPLSAEVADPIGTLRAEAATLYDGLRRNEVGFCRYTYSWHPLLAEDPDTVRLRELERLARADGFVLESYRWDDIGDYLCLVPGTAELGQHP